MRYQHRQEFFDLVGFHFGGSGRNIHVRGGNPQARESRTSSLLRSGPLQGWPDGRHLSRGLVLGKHASRGWRRRWWRRDERETCDGRWSENNMCDMKRIDPPGDHSRHFLQTYVQYEILLWLGCVGRRNTSSLTLSLLNLLRPGTSGLLSWLAPLTLTLCLWGSAFFARLLYIVSPARAGRSKIR